MGDAVFTITDGISARLALLAEAMLPAAAVALNEVAEVTMTESKELVPVKYGVLKDTGKVSQHATPGSLEAKLTYGTDYAAAVHEIPEAPETSEGGRSAHHEHGQWKYLEMPLNAHGQTMHTDVRDKMVQILGLA